jgi:hypothetical protein
LRNNSLTEISETLFDKNTKLEKIWLDGNKIKSLRSTLFDGKTYLIYVDLHGTCAKRFYRLKDFEEMKQDLKRKCADRDEEKLKN